MGKPPPIQKRPSGRTNLASCIVATIFLIFVVIVACIVYLTIFKPKDPNLAVNAVQLPAFSLSNSTVTFTFSQYVTLNNPNRAAFSHYDSSLQLLHAGRQVGFMFIPAGKIDAGRTQYMAATFSVQSFPLSLPGPTMELESRLEMAGRVRVLHLFNHHVGARADCWVSISLTDGSVLAFHC
ncbi:uncharacterized protein LOC131024518 [Salvia miltiorrhiza]|uniref:uncharacterized protein LOC131024518 n=1 Tax=Salvia miltiorrhiza TaxID=226208 RepID=UPI0025AC9D63|nr:uncharacterized protein LOC131024518 [Salvia miltiorrhiza]